MTLSGIILDVDGTLVDSNDAHARAWCDVMTAAGYDVSLDGLRRLIGMGSDKLLPRAIGVDKDSPRGKQLTEQRGAVFRERYLGTLRPTPGARELLERLRQDGLRLIVASSAEAEELTALLDVVGARDLIQETTSSSEVSQSKPDPDIVAAALRKLGRPAGEALMLGDTPYDVEASTGAGVDIIAMRCGGWTDPDLAAATSIYDHPADLLRQYDASPIGRRLRPAPDT